jgi:ATP/maltotriose-dependent transcriptional regulator MalT
MYSSTAAEVADLVDRVARQSDALIENEAASLVITSLYLGLYALDRLDAAGEVLDRAADLARRRGSSADLTLAQANRASMHRRAGRLREAETDARLALAAAGEAGWAGGGLSAITPLVGVLVDQGRADDAERELAAAFPDDQEIPDAPATNFLFFERIGLRMLQGRHAAALDEFDEAVRRAERLFGIDCVHWVGGLGAAAEARAALGDREAAGALADRALGVARRWGTPGYIGQALHAKARVCPDDDAIEMLREVVAQLEGSPVQLELARAFVTLGGFLRRRGARVKSRGPLREGFELAQRCGAEGLAESARAELRASGIRVRREQLDGADALTASERRIAELAADGASNREIAQALFLTVKTVEMHLTHAYRKLDISRRAELSTALPTH